MHALGNGAFMLGFSGCVYGMKFSKLKYMWCENPRCSSPKHTAMLLVLILVFALHIDIGKLFVFRQVK